MKTPALGAITAHVTPKGYRAENIVAYGYYGSQANGLATQNSDEDIFIILDEPVPRKWKSNHSTESDCKLIYAKEWATQTDMLFDIIAIGNIVYPKMVRRPGGKPEYNPWAAYIRNHRPSIYVAAWAAVAAARNTNRRRDKLLACESYDFVTMLKREKRARVDSMKARKIADYIAEMFGNENPAYKPLFNDNERAYALYGLQDS